MAEAIAPDPGQRISSAQNIRARLEEIRNTRPRLAGTPLVNRAVRAADLFWTLCGLYLCAAGFCATLSQTRTPVPALFDLTFSSPGLLLRGFLAVWVLSLGIGMLWIWQLIRLWRFRRVPLRESLPSPFGLRLGSSPTAAILVALTQLFCAWLPPVFALVVMGQSFHWLTPETRLGENFLVVTAWTTDQPFSVWHWDPGKMLDGGAYWLKEAMAGYKPGALRVTDKTSFFIFGQPFLMVLSAVITGIGMLTTVFLAGRSWWAHKRLAALAAGCGALLAAAALISTVRADMDHRARYSGSYIQSQANLWRGQYSDKAMQDFVESGFFRIDRDFEMLPQFRELLADRVSWMGKDLTPDAIQQWFHEDRILARKETRHIEKQWSGSGILPESPQILENTWRYLRFKDPPGGPSTVDRITLDISGEITGSHAVKFNLFQVDIRPIYEARIQPLPVGEAVQFLEQWTADLAAGNTGAMLESFIPVMFVDGFTHADRADVVAVLLAERSQWADFSYTLEVPLPNPIPLPGARWSLRPTFRQQGRRPAKTTLEVSPPFTWTLEIAHTEGGWRIVRLVF